jgi:hypothetical protein
MLLITESYLRPVRFLQLADYVLSDKSPVELLSAEEPTAATEGSFLVS